MHPHNREVNLEMATALQQAGLNHDARCLIVFWLTQAESHCCQRVVQQEKTCRCLGLKLCCLNLLVVP